MSFNNEIYLYNDNKIFISPNYFNRTYSTFDRNKLLKSNKNQRNIKKNMSFYNNQIILRSNIITKNQNYLYTREKILTYHQRKSNSKEKEKARSHKSFDRINGIFTNLDLLHTNFLRNKLINSNLYKLIEKKANDNFIKNKTERQKNTFITMIDNFNENLEEKKKYNFEQNENIKNEISDEKNKEINNILYNKNKNDEYFKRNIFYKTKSDLNIPNTYQKNSMILNFNNNISNKKKSNLKYKSNFILSKTKIKGHSNIDISSISKEKKNVLFNEINSYNNKSIDLNKLKPITLPCIKFNNILDNYFQNVLDGSISNENILAKSCTAKLKFEIINNVLIENYKTTNEKKEFPIIIEEAMIRHYQRAQKFYFEYNDLLNKYLNFLYKEIQKNKKELNNLLEQKELAIKENTKILKRTLELKEQIKTYENFKKLCLMVKHKSKNLDDIPIQEISKYQIKIDLNFRKKYHLSTIFNKEKQITTQTKSPEKKNKNFFHRDSLKNSIFRKRGSYNFDRRGSLKGKNPFLNIINKNNNNINSIPQLPIFETGEDFIKKFNEEEDNIFKKYELSNLSFYEKSKLELDAIKENFNMVNPDLLYNNDLIIKKKNELLSLKEKNRKLINYKNYLLGIKLKIQNKTKSQISLDHPFNINIKLSNLKEKRMNRDKNKNKDSNKIEKKNIDNKNNENNSDKNIFTNDININFEKGVYALEENKSTIALYKIYKKVKEILLNPEINIEKIFNMKKLYSLIKEKKTIKDIHFNNEFFSKEVFCIKLLELLYSKLTIWKEKCLNNKNLRNIYLRLENEREKEVKIYKFKQKILEQKEHIMIRNNEIMNKSSKIIFLQRKKIDPYQKKFIFDNINKKNLFKKKEANKKLIESEDDKYYNFLEY